MEHGMEANLHHSVQWLFEMKVSKETNNDMIVGVFLSALSQVFVFLLIFVAICWIFCDCGPQQYDSVVSPLPLVIASLV